MIIFSIVLLLIALGLLYPALLVSSGAVAPVELTGYYIPEDSLVLGFLILALAIMYFGWYMDLISLGRKDIKGNWRFLIFCIFLMAFGIVIGWIQETLTYTISILILNVLLSGIGWIIAMSMVLKYRKRKKVAKEKN